MSAATIRQSLAGRVLLFVAAAAAVWSAITCLTGGFTIRVGALSLASHDPVRPLLAATLLGAAAWVVLPRGELSRHVRLITGDGISGPARLAFAASVCVLIASVAWNTRASGGSDSSCYMLQADAFARGELLLREPLAVTAPFPDAARMFAPTGWVPSPVEPFAAVPICAPGLAMVMAVASVVAGRDALAAVVPVFAAAAVWLTFVFGRRLDSPGTGAAAAVLLACSPIFLYQAVQPMSDVPATALWLAALVACARRSVWGDLTAGVSAAFAVLVRPNLAIAIAPLLIVLLSGRNDRSWKGRAAPLVRFGVAAAPLLLTLAWMNVRRYGAPLAFGYGDTGRLFLAAHVWPNLARYPRWLLSTETPFILLALMSPWWAWRRGHRETLTLILATLTSVALLLATYLAYVVFNDWWYIRFLLPALPVLLVLSVAVASDLIPSAIARWRPLVIGCLSVVLCVWYLHVAQTRQVFLLQALESRFVAAGRYAARALPPQAVVLAVQESGSIRYHGDRSTLTWDAIVPSRLDATIAWLIAAGRPPFIAVEDPEEPAFRQRFERQRFGALDWPPMAEIHLPVRVRIYDVAQRDRYLAREQLSVEHVR